MRVILITIAVWLAGCGTDHSAELANLEKRIETLSAQIDELEAERGEPVELPSVDSGDYVEKLSIRELSIVDESGVPRIRLTAGYSGSQIWLTDHKQKRILITAREPLADIGDITGVVLQANGQAIAWQTPPVK